MKSFRFLFTAGFVATLLLGAKSQAFEISAYFDPVSLVQLETANGMGDCPGDSDKACWLHAVEWQDAEVLRWYSEMGITNLCVHYRPTDFQTFLGASGESLGVMNERWPNTRFQYLEAQG